LSTGKFKLYSSPMEINHILNHASPTVVNIQGNNIFHILHHN